MEKYIYSGKQRLRCGITTGTCAAAAAKAAAIALSGVVPTQVDVDLPDGESLTLYPSPGPNGGMGIYKDGGDDIDATHGLLICAVVTPNTENRIDIFGGQGVGRVTLSGLEQPVGAPAINQIPRRMIMKALQQVLGESAGACVTLYVPGGELAAQRTANPRLGIVGGISILGTTGIVKPMSQDSFIASIHLELNTVHAKGNSIALLTPGNYGETFLWEQYAMDGAVLCSNFLGEAIDHAAALGFRGCLLVGHIGKLVKLAGGIFQTHSHVADARMEILTAHAALVGGSPELLKNIMAQATTDGALDLLEAAGALAPVLSSLLEKIHAQLLRRGGTMKTGAILYCNSRGELGRTSLAEPLLSSLLTAKLENKS